MRVSHFIGPEPRGGNVRYAEVMHQCLLEIGVDSQILPASPDLDASWFEKGEARDCTIICHSGTCSRSALIRLREVTDLRLIFLAHNPQRPKNMDLYDLVVPVSKYVLSSLLAGGDDQEKIFQTPAYIPSEYIGSVPSVLVNKTPPNRQMSEYEWNPSKLRDLVFSFLDQYGIRPWAHGRRGPADSNALQTEGYVRLAIVSRLARLKKFPELFQLLHDSLGTFAGQIQIHIFGAGPWRQVQAIKREIPESIRSDVYFWGWQANPWQHAEWVDAILLGMPEGEALGLNVLEATLKGIPVVGINGGPFPEVVESGKNGWLLSPTSVDENFTQVIRDLLERRSPCDFFMSDEYQGRFSIERYRKVLRSVLNC